jgi:hypothetical protein
VEPNILPMHQLFFRCRSLTGTQYDH